jgi:long-chain fatty acid transport protein
VRYRPTATAELRMFGDYTRWSVMQTQCVGIRDHQCLVDPTGADATMDGSVLQNLRRKWNDSVGLRVSGSHWLASGTELFGGVGVETAAVPDATLDPGLADANNIAASAGARFRLGQTLFIAASYTHIQYMDRDNTGASELANAQLPTRRPDGGGRYTQWIGLFNLNVEKQF